MNKIISENGLALIKRFEGCRLTAYQDSVGVWTIGYGHTLDVSKGRTLLRSSRPTIICAQTAQTQKKR